MSSPTKETEEPTTSNAEQESAVSGSDKADASNERPPAKRQNPTPVIEISDTESDDSDICAVTTYQASADEVKRIRREYSSTSSSSEYSSDSDSPWEDDSIVVKDKIEAKVPRAQLNPRANRMDDPKFNPELKIQELIDKVTSHWKEEKDLSSKEVTITNDPFQLCLIHDLLGNPEIINNIIDDMNTLDWSRKKMDLYEFHQTTDLANLTWQRSIRGIYDLLKTEVISWVSQTTGLDLRSVSASCSLYGPGDHLLVHDDRLGDRRVAFILYLAPWKPRPPPIVNLQNGDDHKNECTLGRGWAEHMGGALELVAGDDRQGEVARRVYPANNMLAFFTVTEHSFHQVSEVLSLELPRLSINGWFHGPGPEPEPVIPDLPPYDKPSNDVVLLSQWIESTYMCPRARAQVQTQMERSSEVCLRDFLLPERVAALLEQLRGPEMKWERCGPAKQRRYDVAEAGEAGGAAGELLLLLASAAFVRALVACTGLPVTRLLAPQLQRWTPGDFRLLPPRAAWATPRLEAVLYLGTPDRPIAGGSTIYVAPEDTTGESDALVTLPPVSNALNLVYCDAGAASFTKHLSHLTMKPGEYFYIVTCTYAE